MDGTVFPSRPLYPIPSSTNRPTLSPPWKFNSKTQPQTQSQSQSQSSFPIESLLQHLTNSHFPSFKVKPKNTTPVKLVFDEEKDDAVLDFLTTKGRMMFNSIAELPLQQLDSLFESSKSDLLDLDLITLLKALDLSGNWQKSLSLFHWLLSNSNNDHLTLNSHIIELMVRILGRESQHTIAANLFDQIPLDRFSLDVRAYTTVIHAYSRAAKYDRAIALFHRMRDSGLSPTLVTYNVVLDVYGRMGRSWPNILALLQEIRAQGLQLDEFTCSTVISACGREALMDEAKEFFAGLKRSGYVPGTVTYNALLQVFGKAGSFSEAAGVLKEMEHRGCPADSVTYNELVGAYVRAGFYEEGAAVIGEMGRRGVAPNAVTYTTVIDAYGKAGREEEALRMFEQMKGSGCVPNVCTYNAVLGMLGKSKSKLRFNHMLRLLSDMRSTGCAPNRVTWNAMLAVCGDTGNPSHVTRLLREMQRTGFHPDRDTFNTLIGAYWRCGSHLDASLVRSQMVEAGFTPCITTYNALLNALARRGDWKAADSLLRDMRANGFRPNEVSYSLMLQCYARAGNLGGIQRIEKEVVYTSAGGVFPSWVLLRTLVLVNFKCRSLKGMDRAFQELQSRGYKPDLVVFNSMISIFARNGLANRAHETLLLIREAGLRPDLVTYNTLMDMHARRASCWKAQDILRSLQESGPAPDLVSYNIVLKGFCKQGLMEEAVRTLADMTATGIQPCIFTYNTFVTGYAAKSMFDEAAQVIQYMIRNNCWPNDLTYKIVVDRYCRARRFKEAMHFVSNIHHLHPQFDHQSLNRLSSRIRDCLDR